MATVTAFTAARMQEIEDNAIVSGHIDGDDLILVRNDSTEINAGDVRGPIGPTGGSIIVCTSSTRPTGGSLFEGLGIYETDTDRFYMYNGSTWIYRGGLWLCTSGTRPASPFEGLEIYETDTDKKYIYNGSVWVQTFQADWTSFTPVIKNNGQAAVAKTVNYAKYIRQGKRIRAIVSLTLTAGSGGTGTILVELPVSSQATVGMLVGTGQFYDSSGTTFYNAHAILSDVNNVFLSIGGAAASSVLATQLGTSDEIRYEIEYEAAGF